MALDETDLDALVSEAAAILDEAAIPFVSGHGADSAVQKKGNDFATEVDLAIERQVVEALVSRTGIEVHGEEFGGADIDSPLVWVLDPIDGTINFEINSRGYFPGRYRIAIIERLSRECSRMRMHGAIGFDMAYTAAGILGAALNFGGHVWDHAAGVALVRAAGGVVTDLAGNDWVVGARGALAGSPGVHAEMLEIVASVGAPGDY